MGWDWSDEPLLILTAEHFVSVMDRFLSDRLTADQLEEWAENLEQREDVGFASEKKELLDDLLFCLANPSINYEITQEIIHQLRQRLLEG